jgi:hypothetical protein
MWAAESDGPGGVLAYDGTVRDQAPDSNGKRRRSGFRLFMAILWKLTTAGALLQPSDGPEVSREYPLK